MARVGRARKDMRKKSLPMSVSLNSGEYGMMVAAAELCDVSRSAVVRRGIRLVKTEALREVDAARRQNREPDFSKLSKREDC